MSDLLMFRKTQLLGGGATAVDGISATALVGEELCWATVSDVEYTYRMNITSGAAADGVNVIIPVVGTVGDKRWILQPTRTATETNSGVVELATNAEALAGTSTSLAVTPDDLQYVLERYQSGVNKIGVAGAAGFGVGICDLDDLPSGFVPLSGHADATNANYGNYQFSDGSVMVYIPWFVYTFSTNDCTVKGTETYPWQTYGISGISKANPAVVTTTVAHQRAAGDYVWISDIITDTTWKPYSGKLYKVKAASTSTTFTITDPDDVDVDTSALAAVFTNATDANAKIVYTGAEAASYAIHRAFIDGARLKKGFFIDKYMCSKVANGAGYTAASILNGLPLSSVAAHNPFSGCTGGANFYYSAIDLAHRRDGVAGAVNASSIFHCSSIFQRAALAMLALAHGQASSSTANCAWYHATYNFPKGLNNNQAPVAGVISSADTNDNTITFESDGYSNCGKTGSGSPFAKTTHNGQTCGVADLNGLMYEIAIGVTCIATSPVIEAMSQENPCKITVTGHGLVDGNYVQINSITQADWSGCKDKIWAVTKVSDDIFTIPFNASGFGTAYDAGTDPGTISKGTFYISKEATAMKDFTNGAAAATDHWGATGVASMMQSFTPVFETASGATFAQRMGSGANDVLSAALSGAGWLGTGIGMPIDADGIDTTGTDLFGKDYYYQYIRNELCLVSSGGWDGTTNAGVWCVYWNHYRTNSLYYEGFRAACYPS